MDLITPKLYNISGLYINDYGELKSFDETYEFDINTEFDKGPLIDNIVAGFSSGINVFNGLSYDYFLQEKRLKTKHFEINYYDNVLQKNIYPMAFHSSLTYCIEENVKTIACMRLGESNNKYSNAYSRHISRANETSNTEKFYLITADNTGIRLKRAYIEYVFEDDRNETCPTCKVGLEQFKTDVIGKMTNSLIVNEISNATITGDYIHFNLDRSDEEITSEMFNTFFPILNKARIRNIFYKSIA